MTFAKILGRIPIAAQERGTIEVPTSELRSSTLAPVIASLGTLVDFRYAGNNIKLTIGGVVGQLPVSDTHVLVISPKFPLSNMSRMVWTSRMDVVHTAPIDRFYELAKKESYSLDAMLRLFSRQISALLVEGVHRAYRRREVASIPRPHIDFKRTAQRFWVRGVLSTAVVTGFELSAENWANSLIKTAVRIALQHSSRFEGLRGEAEVFREAHNALAAVPELRAPPSQGDLSVAARSIPSFRPSYASALPIAFEIVSGSSLVLDKFSGGIMGASFLINLESVFEAYVRNVLRARFSDAEISVDVLDGNKSRWSRTLFVDSDRYIVKPDLIFRSAGRITAIADAKYTSKTKEEHRYQVLTHALAVGCRTAILIYPVSDNVAAGLRRVGKTAADISEVTLYEYGVPLEADLEKVEVELGQHLGPLVTSAGAAAAA